MNAQDCTLKNVTGGGDFVSHELFADYRWEAAGDDADVEVLYSYLSATTGSTRTTRRAGR